MKHTPKRRSPAQDLNAQRLRIVAALRERGSDGITTIYAREHLDIMAPAPRVFELRKRGWDIVTIWTTTENAQGHKHRNARYVLMRGPGQ